VDKERIAIGKKLGVEVIPDPELGVMQGYMTEPLMIPDLSPPRDSRASKPRAVWIIGISMKMWGMVWCSSRNWGTGRGGHTDYIGCDHTGFGVDDRDYVGEARRTMETLGLAKHTAEELEKL